MLRTAPSTNLLERRMRLLICTRCASRPPHSEALGSEVARPCELTCPVFTHLPLLRKTALLCDPMLASRRDALRQKMEQLSKVDTRGARGESPLIRHRDEVIRGVLQTIGER
jgi:hypothetical protein